MNLVVILFYVILELHRRTTNQRKVRGWPGATKQRVSRESDGMGRLVSRVVARGLRDVRCERVAKLVCFRIA